MSTVECEDCRLGPCKEGWEKCEGLEELLQELSAGEKTDFHKKRGTVSIEEASSKEERLKRAIDEARDDENKYRSAPGRVAGEANAPCRVARRRWWG